MQWLIDLIIEAIGIPPTFIDRGDPLARDYILGDLPWAPVYQDLDLSAIVPAEATAVLLGITLEANAVENFISFRKDGNVNIANVTLGRTQVANIAFDSDLVCPISKDRKIEYLRTDINWTVIFLTVKGWWL